jgi:hypothetical protein
MIQNASDLASYTWVIVLSYVVLGVVFAVLCRSIARLKGFEKTGGYALAGFLFSLLALIYVAGLPDLKARPAQANQPQLAAAGSEVQDPAVIAAITGAIAAIMADSPAQPARPVLAQAAAGAVSAGAASTAGFVIRQIRRA